MSRKQNKAFQHFKNRKKLPKCRCDKFLASKGFHNNDCKYAIAYNKQLNKL